MKTVGKDEDRFDDIYADILSVDKPVQMSRALDHISDLLVELEGVSSAPTDALVKETPENLNKAEANESFLASEPERGEPTTGVGVKPARPSLDSKSADPAVEAANGPMTDEEREDLGVVMATDAIYLSATSKSQFGSSRAVPFGDGMHGEFGSAEGQETEDDTGPGKRCSWCEGTGEKLGVCGWCDGTGIQKPSWPGFEGRECGEHRTCGPIRAWCYDCGEWCYGRNDMACKGCQVPMLQAALKAKAGWVPPSDGPPTAVTSLTPTQAYFARRQVARWLKVKFDFEQITEYRNKEKVTGTWPQVFGPRIRQLEPDADHSGLLYHLLTGGEPLPEPPPLERSYPVYPPSDDASPDDDPCCERCGELLNVDDGAGNLVKPFCSTPSCMYGPADDVPDGDDEA